MNVAAFLTSSLVSSASKVMIRGRPPHCTNWDWCSSTDRKKHTVGEKHWDSINNQVVFSREGRLLQTVTMCDSF